MIDKPALKELMQFAAIAAAADAVIGTTAAKPLALPDDFKLHDIEKYLPNRRRARGSMKTTVLADFAGYVGTCKEVGATCFVNQTAMQATAVLNLGTPAAPGHADNTANYEPPASAAYKALVAVTRGGISQKTAAEFIEDWTEHIVCLRGEDGDEVLRNGRAVASVRDITIEQLNKRGNTDQNLRAERTSFESVAVAEGDNPLPSFIRFTCIPYLGLAERTFVLRLGVLTGDRAPSIVLRVIKAEEHAEQMAEELANLVRGALQGNAPVVIGSYAPAT